MPSRTRAFAVVFAVAVAAAIAYAAGPGANRFYKNDALRIRGFEPPGSWQAQPQPNYPRILIAYAHPDGGRLTLSAQKVPAGTTAEAVARAAQPGLLKQGFYDITITYDRDSLRDENASPRVNLDAKLDGGRRFLKQVYLVDGSLAYIISLAASTVNAPEMARDLDQAARSLSIGPEHPEADGGVAR